MNKIEDIKTAGELIEEIINGVNPARELELLDLLGKIYNDLKKSIKSKKRNHEDYKKAVDYLTVKDLEEKILLIEKSLNNIPNRNYRLEKTYYDEIVEYRLKRSNQNDSSEKRVNRKERYSKLNEIQKIAVKFMGKHSESVQLKLIMDEISKKYKTVSSDSLQSMDKLFKTSNHSRAFKRNEIENPSRGKWKLKNPLADYLG